MDDKVYYPRVIEDTPFPSEEIGGINITQSSPSGVYYPKTIKDQEFPIKRQATELLSNVLNTKSKKILGEFQFTSSGALQIGKQEDGISGDMRISPAGLVARNKAGETTVAIDAETGDATFKGEVQAGSVVTGEVIVGNNNVIIDGEGKRIIINDGTNDRIIIGYQENGF
jgi:hypothetical protein